MNATAQTLKKYGPKKIMVIDDDIDLREQFQWIFEMEDYDVLLAQNGQEAIKELEALEDKDLPQLILLDYNMPVMDGNLFNSIKLQTPRIAKIPVVLITACGDMVPVMNKVAADAYVEKPIELNQLLSLVFNFIHRREASRYSFLA